MLHANTVRRASIIASICVLLTGSTTGIASTQTSAFTYQGVLENGGSPLNGTIDLQFRLFDAAAAGAQVGATIPINGVSIVDGLVTQTLDFGALALNGEERWLEVSVASPAGGGVGPFTTLAPRQKLESAPYAAFALQTALSGTYGNAVNLTNAANTFTGAFTGSGAGLTNLSAAALTGTINSGNIGGTYSNAVTFSNAGNIFTGSHSGDGSALTGLNASNISSGTLNIARFPTGGAWTLSSNLNIDSDTLFINPTTNLVGIGTTTPGGPLDVLRTSASNVINPLAVFRSGGAGASSGSLRTQNSAGNHFNFGITAAGDFGIGYNANIGLAGDLIRMTPTGNTGLGTLTPVNRLDVEGAAAIGAAYAGTTAAPANGLIVEGDVGIGTTAPAAKLHVSNAATAIQGVTTSTSGRAVYGSNTAVTGLNYGVYGESSSTSGRGVFGSATAATGTTMAGRFENSSTGGIGVLGAAFATTGTVYGGWFQTVSTGGRGLIAFADVATGVAYGVRAESGSTSGRGVLGLAYATSGTTYGVLGQADSTTGHAVYGVATATTGLNYGGYFENESTGGRGVFATANATTGATYGGRFFAASTGGRGVQGFASATTGITEGAVGQADSNEGAGVFGLATSATGLTYGVFARSDSATGYGVYGECSDNIGVGGEADGLTGVNFGGRFLSASTDGFGVYGRATAITGVNYGVYGQAQTSAAGFAVFANGDMGASGLKPFRIDHPDDPANKYLLHYAAESPEVINFYSGKVSLNGAGEAVVELPLYFAKINKDPRYTLTAIGAAMPNLHVAEEIDETSLVLGATAEPGDIAPPCWFRIAGGTPGMKVSWEVKAVRNDRYVQQRGAPVEVAKQNLERGTYQHPELYGEAPSKTLAHMEIHAPVHRHVEVDPSPEGGRVAGEDGPPMRAQTGAESRR